VKAGARTLRELEAAFLVADYRNDDLLRHEKGLLDRWLHRESERCPT
jgi:hypothetical protein